MNSYGEATYWHNHPDLSRLAQTMREHMDHQRMTVDDWRNPGCFWPSA